ncbi:MAG: Crp/Fnr family transcriptional regulator [Spirochaetes bacterium]|jgi:CRP-like cAMP-binding protein|nr:Crp/Fnr family transcriptional regulator [Spirochaetota bacterium]
MRGEVHDAGKKISEHFPHFARYWDRAAEFFTFRKFPAKKILLRGGETADNLYAVLNGSIRAYLIKEDGREITMQFFFEGQMVASMESFFSRSPGRAWLETMEETEAAVISRENLDKIMSLVDPTREGMLLFMKSRLIYYMNLHNSFILDPPEKRYIRLAEENPGIIERVPQHYIASYLGITPVSLSRIRARIKKSAINKG